MGLWELNGYMPMAYKVTPWERLFPNLSGFPGKSTLSNIHIARIYAFYLTRLHFHHYLTFLSHVGGKFCGNDSVMQDIQEYGDACNALLDSIGEVAANVGNAPIGDEQFLKIVHEFDMSLKELVSQQRFFSLKVYQVFFDHYSYFTDAAYGFVYTFGDTYRAVVNEKMTFKAIPHKPFNVLTMLKDALRSYPVINMDGGLYVCHYLPNCIWGGIGFKFDYGNGIEHGFPYIAADRDVMRFYKVSLERMRHFNSVDGDGCKKIRGGPMLYDLPFDLLAGFAKPSES